MNTNNVTLDPTAAFTAFGRVTVTIAACEQIMRLALGGLEVEKAKGAADPGSIDFQPYTLKVLRWDFGQLSHRLRTKLKLPDDPWLQIFKDAKELRNSVAHEFWSPYYPLLRSQRGVDIIIRHCNIIERHFSHLGNGLIHVTKLNLAIYLEVISDQSSIEQGISDLSERIVEAEKAIAALPAWNTP